MRKRYLTDFDTRMHIMRWTSVAIGALLLGCRPSAPGADAEVQRARADSARLAEMITIRERAMSVKDLAPVMEQFAEDATWISARGLLLEGKASVLALHQRMMGNDTADYVYASGDTRVRVVDSLNALVYYPWKMTWYRRSSPHDTTLRDFGIMTLTARKRAGTWRWIAVTNQYSERFWHRLGSFE